MIIIGAPLMERITQEAETTYPEECCGLLAGYGDLDGDVTVTRVEVSVNVATSSKRDRFEVDPKVRFDLMRALDGGAERIVGHFHSHPDHPAAPSEHDLKMAFEPDLLWLIVALSEGRVSEIKTHRVDAEASTFEELPLSIV